MKQLLLLCLITFSGLTLCDAQYFGRNKEDNKIELKNGDPYIKEFDASRLNELTIDNEHGYVNVSTWNKELVQINVVVNIETNNQGEAEEILKFISFEERKYAHRLNFTTAFLDDFFSNYPFTINYTVKVPNRIDLIVNNSIGDVKIDSIAGKVTLNHSYGNLTLTNIGSDKNHEFNLSFVEGLIDSFGTSKVDFNNCTLNISNATKINGSTTYCMASFNNIASTNLKTFTDRLTITNSDSIKLIGSQFIGKLEQVQTYVFCELDKGQLLVDAAESIKDVTISNTRVNSTLILPHAVSYFINGEVFNGTFTHPTPQKLQLLKEEDNVTFSGFIGTETEHPTNIIFFNKDASITIKN